MSTDVPFDDPTALARFGRLEVVARLLIEGRLLGRHRSPFRGGSAEFVEHRQYTPGDELRHIDWRAYAKSGQYYVKQFEEQTNLRAYLLVDASGSMGYAGRTLSKYSYARVLAAALAYLLLSQRDACGLVTFADRVLDRWPPSTSQTTFQQITQLLEARECGEETQLAAVLEAVLPTLQRRSLVFLLSDGFDDVPALAATLKLFRSARHEIVFLQVVAPEEEDFTFTRPTLFRDLEVSGRQQLVDPLRLRSSYLEQYREFNRRLAECCLEAGIDHVKVVTSQPYHEVLGAYLAERSR
jgi:uncharacterized protein (DUF58 family)